MSTNVSVKCSNSWVKCLIYMAIFWNAKITGYAQNFLIKGLAKLFDKMPHWYAVPRAAIVALYAQNFASWIGCWIVWQTASLQCRVMGCNHRPFMHKLAKWKGLANCLTKHQMHNMHKTNLLKEARDLFDKMQDAGIVSKWLQDMNKTELMKRLVICLRKCIKEKQSYGLRVWRICTYQNRRKSTRNFW